jgi:hypothetical protein
VGNVTKVDGKELFKEVLVSMIESKLYLFKIHRKMIFGNTPVVVQDMLGVTPKPFNAIDMIALAIRECFTMIKAMMLAQAFKGIVAPKGIGVVD